MRPIRLGVNIDHVATLRQARGTTYPDPVDAALLAEQAGADSITAHLREDRRHIQDRDIENLRQRLRSKLNLEMAVTDEMIAIARRVRPQDCCLVPERREELTTEGGLEVKGHQQRMNKAVGELRAAGIHVALFVDPDDEQFAAILETRAPAIEIHTGAYANASGDAQREELKRISDFAKRAADAGLKVHAGHGLTTENVGAIAAISEIEELNIGHWIVGRSVTVGLVVAVKEMKDAMQRARTG
jgi:pyridoxine 5-phosphate synthase